MVLSIFVNFLAAPTIALAFDVDLPQTNIVLSEEENHHSGITFSEKTLPDTINIHDFLKFFLPDSRNKAFYSQDDLTLKSPHFAIISPPPEA
ncbi:hypothetical protein [Chryseobacterium sp. MFBS3-17]|uniref:hypothetical protein n=1 Tax=Chryseobacterium sp. MFBS3-17 TaxID=2886689 RepID=UPI001D0EE6BF|nr:hypothetical protein [Chryseobacterium sp. MFBS3-17]MCC2589415.1 hypothetical protein [Chryseobacterium sp. MFBS3-17]